jgi:hypothetical protein
MRYLRVGSARLRLAGFRRGFGAREELLQLVQSGKNLRIAIQPVRTLGLLLERDRSAVYRRPDSITRRG